MARYRNAVIGVGVNHCSGFGMLFIDGTMHGRFRRGFAVAFILTVEGGFDNRFCSNIVPRLRGWER